ncbi:MAG: tRNA glutamyl-Q(34) synthetase GluQRS [Mariprofundus sp.]|nr:tRNA glutamyl-Q(34) synthetase GluQRS [Mariprofundus sp.]
MKPWLYRHPLAVSNPNVRPWRTRFAPSPTGLLHVGNAYSALQCATWAERHQTELLLRIEDIDYMRCKPEYSAAIVEDLSWLGIHWQQSIRFQSQCTPAYQQAIGKLRDQHMIYPCFCSRKHIRAEIDRMASAPHAEDGQSVYPGLCRYLSVDEQQQRMQHEPFAWRLNAAKAMQAVGADLHWHDESGQHHAVQINHDVIIGRKDIAFSYHLAVVMDDAEQGISHIIRGNDLADSTGIHRVLQSLLGLPEPVYIHHALLCSSDGQRLSKRNGSMSLQTLRQMGVEAKRLRDFLCHLETPVWPFSINMQQEILQAFGKASSQSLYLPQF